MRLNVRRFVAEVLDNYKTPYETRDLPNVEGHYPTIRVAEFGSKQVDSAVETDIRPLVTGSLAPIRCNYTGFDYSPGPGVDRTCDLHQPPNDDMVGAYDLIFCLDTFEHVRNPYLAMVNLAKMLKPSGVLVLSVPYYFQWHARPHYWGITPDGLSALMQDAKLHHWMDMDPPARKPGDQWQFPHTVVAVASPGSLRNMDLEGLRDSKWHDIPPVQSLLHFNSDEDRETLAEWISQQKIPVNGA